jgi:hypothetical protein
VRIKNLTLGCLAAGLLLGAPQAMAQSVDVSLVVGVDSASGNVEVTADVCMQAISELIEDGFEFRSSSPVGGNGGPDFTAYLFTEVSFLGGPDVATLYCVSDINLGGDPGGLGDPGGPGGPCGPGGPGGPGGC